MRTAGPRSVPGAVLAGLLLASVPAAGAGGGTSLGERLAAASPDRGEKAFRVCSACHTIERGGAHTVGPNLWGVVGRPVAAAEGFDRYTPAMVSFGGVWSPERLDRYLRQPAVEVRGTAMVFPGIPDIGDRADLIAWLDRNSPAPADFGSEHAAGRGGAAKAAGTAAPGSADVSPASQGGAAKAAGTSAPGSAGVSPASRGGAAKAVGTAASGSAGVSPASRGSAAKAAGTTGGEVPAPRSAPPPELGVLVDEEGAEETYAYCAACHSERIVAQQGLTRADWEELLEQMVEENGMNPIEEPDLGRVLAYLATHYGPDRPNFPNP